MEFCMQARGSSKVSSQKHFIDRQKISSVFHYLSYFVLFYNIIKRINKIKFTKAKIYGIKENI